MSQIVETLKKKGDTSVDVYPNIITDNIPASAVTSAKIADGAITSAKIANGAINTDVMMVDGYVTTRKLANDAVTSDKIADDAIFTNAIQDGVVTADKIDFALYYHNVIVNAVSGATTYQFLVQIISKKSTAYTYDDLLGYMYTVIGDQVPAGHLINGEGHISAYSDDLEATIYSYQGTALGTPIVNYDLGNFDSHSIVPYTPINIFTSTY